MNKEIQLTFPQSYDRWTMKMITTFNSKSVNAEPACNSPHTFKKRKKKQKKGKSRRWRKNANNTNADNKSQLYV